MGYVEEQYLQLLEKKKKIFKEIEIVITQFYNTRIKSQHHLER